MLRLDLKRQPSWVDLGHGIRLKCEPMATAVMAAARRDVAVTDLAEDASEEDRAIAMAKAVGRRTIVDWQGVGDVDGNPVPVSPEGIDALLDIWVLFDAFQVKYLASGLLLDQEKNASALSPNGTSAGVTDTAPLANGCARSAQPESTHHKP